MREKLRNVMKQKPTIGIIALVSTIIFVLASTLAWFSATDARDNNFKADFAFNVDLVDEFETPETFSPDQLVDKTVGAKNTEDIDAFVRVMAFPVAGKDQTPLSALNGVEVIYENLNTTDWTYGDDGYYYYLGVLAPGEETAPLFTGVQLKIDDEVKDDYQNANFDIVVKVEATGTKTNEYRLSWWGSTDAQSADPLKTIDETLQTALGN